MKDIMPRYQTDFLFYIFLLIICSNINTLQIAKTGSITVDSNAIDNSSFKANYYLIQSQKANLKQTTTSNKEKSNFEFFKNFLTNFIKLESIKEKLLQTEDNVHAAEGPSGNLIKEAFKKQKTQKLNFNNEAVKIAEIPICDLDSCERENGVCISDSECKCNYGHINYFNGSAVKKACDYKLSFQLYALMLEIFLPFGLGHIYCKRYLIGFIKLLVLLIIPFIAFLVNRKILENKADKSPFIAKVSRESSSQSFTFVNLKKIVSFLISIWYFVVFFAWFIFDLVIFSANKHKDGSGFDLIPI